MSMNYLAQVTRAYQNCKIRLGMAQDMWTQGLLSNEEMAAAHKEFSSLRDLLKQAKIEAGVGDEHV